MKPSHSKEGFFVWRSDRVQWQTQCLIFKGRNIFLSGKLLLLVDSLCGNPEKRITFATHFDRNAVTAQPEETNKNFNYLFMKDFKNDSTSTLSRFGRDKRTRMSSQTAERVERRPRTDFSASATDERTIRPKRVSYNPHFTEDNRPVNDNQSRGRGFGERKAFDKPYGKKPYEHHTYNERGNSSKFHSAKPANRFYDENGDIDFNREETPRFERKPQGRKPFTTKGSSEKRYGAKSGESRYDSRDNRKSNNYSNGDKKRSSFRSRDDKPKSYPKYNPSKQTEDMRLNRFIAQSGICSRREADDYIAAGLVSVNGVIVTELGTKVKPTDEVKFNDSRVQGEHKVYLVLNKPKGYVTSLEDPHADKTVMELVKGACTERIYPVGRLDKNSVGLLLFTNDGDLTRQLTHPSLMKKKIYQVTLDKALTRADMDKIAEGITLDDGEIYADEISYVKEDKKEIGIEIHSGRNRIVRRIFEHLGYSVQKLDRVYYAGLTKKNLKRGGWRFLTKEEVQRLKSGQYE